MRASILSLLVISTAIWAADPPPPSKTSTVGSFVKNPVTNANTTVSALISDNNPDATPETAFVQTADGYTFLVKAVGEKFWNTETPPNGFNILSNAAANTVTIQPDGSTGSQSLSTQLLTSDYDSIFAGNSETGGSAEIPPSVSGGANGLRLQAIGANGKNGRAGALIIPPSSGKNGTTPGDLTHTNLITISAVNKIGIEACSIGGNGGDGGDSYLNVWSGKPGGTGAPGGKIVLDNGRADFTNVQVSATGNGMHGIYAYSISGQGGDGGSGFGAPGGGPGGGSFSGGSVTVNNYGRVYSDGVGAHGIFGLSRSGQGGSGGSQYGLFGSSGGGSAAGNGGPVDLTNKSSGTIQTSGSYSHGMVATSIGGAGGNAGNSWNAFVSLPGAGNGGGSGGNVTATNEGTIVTLGNYSRGIFAQSGGGGGGSGGDAGGLVSIGGTGAAGGNAGTATARNYGSITTNGIQSDGIFVQSAAGGGGGGGSGGGLVAIGGNGAAAGNGSTVRGENFGTIETSQSLVKSFDAALGKDAFSARGGRGIVAQSIGGGGGDGGSTGGPVAVGGSGGGGGSGGAVHATNRGEIRTKGNDATGMFVQSVGGGGGNGGSAGSVSAFVGVAVGGEGAQGGNGGVVNVTLDGQTDGSASVIRTEGRNSFGVFAQSVGGGGGNGGGAWQVTGGAFGAVSIAVGGDGGAGGVGGVVTMSGGTGGTSIVETDDDYSAGIFVQSVGGGGGNGGYAVSVAVAAGPVGGSLSIGVGGTGGSGGAGGTVTVGSYDGVDELQAGESGFNGSILTKGERSPGFIAQSVGGGGGNGGSSVSAAAAGGVIGAASVSVGVGGDGGGAGIGGNVTVGTSGNVTTEGDFSAGMLVQSVGGGGGNGGGSVSGALSGGGTAAFSVGVGLGGKAGGGGDGGTVKFATLTGTVRTEGESSAGITAQSVGGGGGNGGYSVAVSGAGAGVAAGAVSVGLGGEGGTGGHGGSVTANLQSDVVTTNANSTGIVVQSVGGGGGNGGFNVSAGVAGAGVGAGSIGVGLGGKGGNAGLGGVVDASSAGEIDTTGDNSGGFVAQSIGGGGGNGGFNVTATIAGAGVGTGGVSVGLGGGGGGGGNSSGVTARSSGDVVTRGDYSTGILAQSVGGGGGNGGFNVSVALTGAGTGSGSVGVGLGGSGAGGGDGSTVDLTVNNDVSTGTATSGDHSPGVVAQSIGGGGGNGGFDVTVSGTGAGVGSGAVGVGLGGTGAGGGHGDRVNNTMVGDITTRGDYAGGLLVQSVGGGGGNGGFSVTAAIAFGGVGSGSGSVGLGGSGGGGGDGGAVTSSLTGDVITVGDNSTGVVAQSLGGGGGNGGFSITGQISGSGVGGGGASVGIGGAGGTGGDSGRNIVGDRATTVVVDNTVIGDVTTSGADSGGVLAQSVGGGGGNGGFAITGAINVAGTGGGGASVGIGGSGGGGGHSAKVVNRVTGDVTTANSDAFGILAQSVGGGGGNGGFNVTGNVSGAGAGAGGASVGIGGSGGEGGDSGDVSNTVVGDVATNGVRSGGVIAQSLGGGGGNGGFTVAGTIAGAGTGSGGASVGIGGSGGDGGDSAAVTNSVTGDVTTLKDDSDGVMAQSIGGGGGNGGFSVTGTITGAGTGTAGVSVGIGGSGGGGGKSGTVTNTVVGDVGTAGLRSNGVIAQSLGGGGGNGGFSVAAVAGGAGTGAAGVSVGIGGSGGDGGNSAAVSNSVTGDVTTTQNESNGVVAQSVGGGGGNGGFNVSGTITGAGTGAAGVSVGIGGSGGKGGDSDNVTNTVRGDVDTNGVGSNGIMAQSLGGGGGNGGFNVSGAISGGGTGAGAVSVGIGGSGGDGGNSANVTNSVTGDVVTRKNNSVAIMAQSVGGGGGNGGFNVSGTIAGAGTGAGGVSVGIGGSGGGGGDSGIVRNTVIGNVGTNGVGSSGVVAQSLGGGGGNGGFNVSGTLGGAGTGAGAVSVGIGGSGGGGGNSASVTNSVTGDVGTLEDDSVGIMAQSVGGGGGNGGFNVSGAISVGGKGAGGVSVGIGGSGGNGGNSGNVDNTVVGDVVTSGERSGGIAAQSLGGGGGNGAFNVSAAISGGQTGTGALSVGIGGSGGDGGDSADVINRVTGDVFTSNTESFGIMAQSVGGGGGNGGMNVSGAVSIAKSAAGAAAIGIGGSGGGGGDAGNVTSTVSGYVQTTGLRSAGITTQSVGGGGGTGGLNISGVLTAAKTGSGGLAVGVGGFGGDGGNSAGASSTVTGGVITTGNESAAIHTQSLGGGGGNGGTNVTAAVNLTKENGGTLGVGVGGFGGLGGNAGNVSSTVTTTVDHDRIGTTGDDSSGIMAQSLGGGGGNGGVNVTGAVNLTGKNGASVGVGVGGFGGVGGNAGNVTVNATGPVMTEGNNSHGLLAQSIGGGGGNGGTNVTGSLAFTNSSSGSAKTVSASIGIGGFGGGGGTAGDVAVTYAGTITAQPRHLVPETRDPLTNRLIPAHVEFKPGTGSHGLAAQSIGGGGGNGGINVSAGISYARSEGDGYGLIVGFGGFGGDGGDAGNVGVTVNGGESIHSYGAGHSALLAQSLGGGGGNGGLNVSGGITSDSSLIVGVGGFGGGAGIGRSVSVNAATDLYAGSAGYEGVASAGLLAQSIGGGGGNGGLNVSAGLVINKSKDLPSVNFGLGGSGGTGAISDAVHVNHAGNVTSSGEWVHGVMAQSIGGGGGTGGMNVTAQINLEDSKNSGGKTDLTIAAGIGGKGGSGGDAGNVDLTQNGVVSTSGDYARGVAAQSIGGGGGTGGMNITGVFAKNSSPISVGIGGSGGDGGEAGSVLVNRGSSDAATGRITTDGASAYGIEASSIGGGGGDAGMNFIAAVSQVGSDEGEAGFAAQFAIGGNGGTPGSGNSVAVNNYSDIETARKNSHGILAQSIGGGGGNADLNVALTYATKNDKNMGFSLTVGGLTGDGGDGGRVDVVHVGNIQTWGGGSYGVLAQSIGGGGGNAAFNKTSNFVDGASADINIGSQGGTGGVGGDVTLSSNGSIVTHGKGSFGLLAQSVGNGGGNSSASSFSVATQGSKTKPAESAALAVGFEGGQGGHAGNVEVDAAGWVSTDGSSAHAIFAQSVGGGGGNGGSATTAGGTAASAALSLGGQGGEGGYGGTVDVESSAAVYTRGASSVGILAQSVGGGGGTGGSSTAGGVKSKTNGITVAVGGKGGSGMYSSAVDVDNSGLIVTDGVGSHGVLAQSLGGGGGNSGMVVNTVGNPFDEKSTDRIVISMGAEGGDGAQSGDVTVTNTGSIGTNSARSVGVFAQSVGGGGGNSDTVLASSESGVGGESDLHVSIGAAGGEGGVAGAVSAFNRKDAGGQPGMISTVGDESHGILAMSVGGGGGNGSNAIAREGIAGPAFSDTMTTSVAFRVGGTRLAAGGIGGVGGTGGNVLVENDGTIVTRGARAHGILAQSVGGGGGNGGFSSTGDLAIGLAADAPSGSSATMAIGGIGGDGNVSGNVTVTNTGTIEVFGTGSYGIYAQSVGGGGGNGGFSAALSRDILTNPTTSLQQSLMGIGIGGIGGSGADSGAVLVTHTGTITSHGDNSYGIFAQSVGGGGGSAAYSVSSPAWMAADLVLKTAIGATEGASGIAGTATIDSTGNIIMLGRNSRAQLAQSINGGGGNVDLFLDVSQQAVELGDDGIELPGGQEDKTKTLITNFIAFGADLANLAMGGKIEAKHAGDLYALGKNGMAALTQSVGGGGGSASSEIVVDEDGEVVTDARLGGTNSTDSSGGDISGTRTGDVVTAEDQSLGAVVQSIGGGGGSLSSSVVRPPSRELSVLGTGHATGLSGCSAIVALGADGSVGNDGGNIDLEYDGDAMSMGDIAPALVIQSIGAGGGQSTFTGLDCLDVLIGSTGMSTGNGGDISIVNNGDILTEGKRSDGIVIQSIGGGGGLVLTDLDAAAVDVDTRTDNFGDGGDITFTQTGDVMVTGDESMAVVVQSLGGGGGIVDRVFMGNAGGGGNSGSITIDIDGDVAATGQGGVGIFAQSTAAGLQGDIDIVLAAGRTLYAGAGGVGAWISGGMTNTFVSNGTIGGADGLLTWSVRSGDGDDAVTNNGMFVGQFDLGTGVNSFTNEEDAVFAPGPQLLLGAPTNVLTNKGTMYQGDTQPQRTFLTGSYVQTGTATTFSELDFGTADPNADGGDIDQLFATGTASLAGRYDIMLLNPHLIPYGTFQKTLFGGAMGVTNAGMFLTTAPSVVITYELLYPTGIDAVLQYDVDFSPAGLDCNLTSVGDYFNRIQAAGSSPELADVITKLVYDPDLGTYATSLTQMSPEYYGDIQSQAIYSNDRLGQLMMGRGGYRTEFGTHRFWFNAVNESTDTDAHGNYQATDFTDNGLSVGFETGLGNDWLAGFGASYWRTDGSGYGSQWDSDGDTVQVGIGLRRTTGPWQYGGAITYGWSTADVTRRGGVVDSFAATSSRDLQLLSGTVGGSYQWDIDRFYIRGLADLGLTYLQTGSASESGAGALDLMIDGTAETHVWLRPGAEFGYNFDPFGNGMQLKAFGVVNLLQYLTDPSTQVGATIEGAPPGVSAMRVDIPLTQTAMQYGLGIELTAAKAWSAAFRYSASFSEHSQIDAWTLNVSLDW